ncbi:MAG: hypothetical protein CL867_02585 [Cytophagaceae bacterium]|nr:hypothetical protein [Cytophagaceae bacterium]
MPRLLEEHKDNTQLLRAAMANPILALNHIGIELTPALEVEVERRVRFDAKTRKKISDIENDLEKATGKKVSPFDTPKVQTFLKAVLSKTKTKSTKKSIEDVVKALAHKPDSQKILKVAFGNAEASSYSQKEEKETSKDPLTRYRKEHEVIPILLKYRALEANFPKLASKEVFNKILKKKKPDTGVGFSKVRFHLQDREQRKATNAKD